MHKPYKIQIMKKAVTACGNCEKILGKIIDTIGADHTGELQSLYNRLQTIENDIHNEKIRIRCSLIE